jgi:hypothetical protein
VQIVHDPDVIILLLENLRQKWRYFLADPARHWNNAEIERQRCLCADRIRTAAAVRAALILHGSAISDSQFGNL